MSLAETSQGAWSDAVVRAAAEASRLQPLATVLFAGAMLLIAGQHAADPLAYALDSGDPADAWRELGRHLVEATPAIVLSFALLETRAYLSRLAKGELWGPSTAHLLGRVGSTLLAAAVAAFLLAPTLMNWIEGNYGGFHYDLEASHLVLAGIGLLLMLIAKVIGDVVSVAASLKSENDQIV